MYHLLQMNINWLKSIIEQFIAYLLRPRHFGIALLSISSVMLMSIGSGVDIKAKGFAGIFEVFEFSTGQGLTGNLLSLVTCLMCVTWVIGLGMVVMTYGRQWCEGDVRRVIVIELRGLVDTSDRPLLSSLPRSLLGRRVDCLVNVRPFLSVKPPQVTEALQELAHVRRQLRQLRADTTRENVTVVAGGVMQVPLQFYAGTLMDDEGAIQLYDWERTNKQWKALTESDDGSRFKISGLELPIDAREVVVAVSASYDVAMEDISATFPNLPLVSLALEKPLPNTLWSETAQAELTQQFLHTLATLANAGVKTVHLILAAPATLSIRFGMAYDGRNMPDLRCYQREIDQRPPYPWSIQMPKGDTPVEYLLTSKPTDLAG